LLTVVARAPDARRAGLLQVDDAKAQLGHFFGEDPAVAIGGVLLQTH
jgi:uncharacterized membrane protein